MSGWTRKQIIEAVIAAVVTGIVSALGTYGYSTVENANKVPSLEKQLSELSGQLTKQSDRVSLQLKDIRVTLVALMQKTGHPPTSEELEKLLAGVFDVGETKAALIKQAQLEQGSGAIALPNWVPTEFNLAPEGFALSKGEVVKDKKRIAQIIFLASVSHQPVYWEASDTKLKVRYGSDSVISMTPEKPVSTEELKVWASSLNAISKDFEEIGKQNPKQPENGHM